MLLKLKQQRPELTERSPVHLCGNRQRIPHRTTQIASAASTVRAHRPPELSRVNQVEQVSHQASLEAVVHLADAPPAARRGGE
jgi:hypothetical protein